MRRTLFVIASLFFSFAAAQTLLNVKQIKSYDQINLKYDSVNNYIRLFTIPLEFKIIFDNTDSLWISRAYNYAMKDLEGDFWNGIPLKFNDEYVSIFMKYSKQPDTCFYNVLSRYFLNSDSDLQDSLSQYIDKMKNEGLNSLNVGTLDDFKKKHPVLIDRILKNDSIGFDVRRAPRKFIEFISFPVKY